VVLVKALAVHTVAQVVQGLAGQVNLLAEQFVLFIQGLLDNFLQLV
jgi:hypothetical protein